jgi:hypothetical protein
LAGAIPAFVFMKKIYSYLIAIPIALWTLVPAIKFYIPLPRGNLWFWFILIAGFLGFYTLFLKTNIFLKIIAVGSFISCFFSNAPYVSFTAYLSIVTCCYLYVLFSRIKDWEPIFKTLQIILLMNVFLIFMQAFGQDSLLSFGLKRTILVGTIGQNMQVGSLSTILTATLISFNPLNFILLFLIGICCNSTWALFCVAIGFLFYAWTKNKKAALAVFLVAMLIFSVLMIKQKKLGNLGDHGRLGVWKKTIEMANYKPRTQLAGWGPGTYRYIFQPLSGMLSKSWKTTHNDPLQILFEFGYPGLAVMIGFFTRLFYLLLRTKEYLCLSGLVMVMADMQVHFPMRCLQIGPILILFLAYCEYRIKEKMSWPANLT